MANDVEKSEHADNSESMNNHESADDPAPKKNLLDQFIDVISGIFIPVLSVLIATGMIKGFTALLIALSIVDPKGGTNQLLQIIGDCFSRDHC